MKTLQAGIALGLWVLLAVGCGDDAPSDAGTGMDAALQDAGSADGGATTDAGGPADAGPGDDGGASDAGAGDGGASDGGATDAGVAGDAGPACGGSTMGSCPGDLTCLCCDLGGPASRCLCTTECTSSDMCTSGDRPTCDVNGLGGAPTGLCRADDFTCCWGCD